MNYIFIVISKTFEENAKNIKMKFYIHLFLFFIK